MIIGVKFKLIICGRIGMEMNDLSNQTYKSKSEHCINCTYIRKDRGKNSHRPPNKDFPS